MTTEERNNSIQDIQTFLMNLKAEVTVGGITSITNALNALKEEEKKVTKKNA